MPAIQSGQPDTATWATHDIKADKTANLMLFGGIGLFIVSLILAAVIASSRLHSNGPGGFPFIGLSLLIAVIGLWRKRTPLVHFGADFMRIRIAPAAGWHTLLYSEVRSCTSRKNKFILAYLPHGAGKARTVKLPAKLMSADDVIRFQMLMEKRTGVDFN